MKKITFIIIPLFTTFSLNGQVSIEGTLFDDQRNETLDFVKVRIANTNIGVLSNRDGFFKITSNLNDSLIFTHPLYPKLIVSASYFQFHDTLYINQTIQDIPEMVAFGVKDEVYDLVITSRKKLQKIDDFNSKAYLSLESYSNDVPLEMIQSYYNANVKAEEIGELLLKNGRIGLNGQTDQRFVSLNSTKILLQYNLFNSKKTAVLPVSPLQLNKRQLKSSYKIELVSVENGIHKFHLIPRESNEQNNAFEAFMFINKLSQEIHRIELIKRNIGKKPFVPINEKDKIDSLNLFLTYNFSTPSSHLYNLELKYDFIYQNPLGKRNINTQCNLIFYDNYTSFDLPLGSFSSVSTSDYEKIIYQPFNSFFWGNNVLISPSKKDIENEKFFRKNGVLLNFDNLKTENELFKNKIQFWDGQRIFLNQINGDFNFEIGNSTLLDYHNMTTLSDHYNFQVSIFLDECTLNDSTNYLVKTLVNLDESFYHLQKNKNTICFINSYFDLVEIYKRELEKQLTENEWSHYQTDSLYNETIKKMNSGLKEFLKEVQLGKNETALEKYIQLIRNELGIDNSLLIESDDLKLIINGDEATEKNAFVDRYNYGSALLKIGRYEDALKILKEAEDLGDEHPWLFYNMGVCYLKIEQREMACEYFNKSGSLGENLEEEIRKICFSNEIQK